jgi:hypothetical protein
MSKLKQSVIVQRQIPEHVRENYPVFVEFVKLYYDFLQESQAQELEKIRDIDTTLDEFIDRFKSELARNMPVELASNKRLLLKHIREFYLSRGSEASYKFLFRTLFGKEATLFYPSTQVLRVSDGRWKQDVSIFIEVSGTTTTLHPINGTFATITTSRKKIQTFVENVIEYSANIFEVFIQRDYANEIEVGSTISETINGVTYTGTILACPSKITVYKSGKGFKVGDLYALKTNIGRGCVIKITKTDSEGSIKAIQVVRFGLDYQTTFYSYLSSKTLAAFEYIHPIHLNTGTAENPATPPGYDPDAPAYNEGYSGFLDYGFANKQEYFYYDTDIPVGTVDRNSDRFFADPSYVGDVIQQFYNDSDGKVMDEDIAIIQIDLGAVARYPGYYQNANGFISDEMYLHDGRYYQAFSYVIRVEEELRKYADVVKALIHPAGMKAYSEYSIFKEIDVRAVMPSLSQLIQFAELTNDLDDRGYNWSSYDAQEVDGEIVYTPSEGANKVYSRQGKVAIFSTKNIHDLLASPESRAYIAEKAIGDFVQNLVVKSKGLSKTNADAITDYLETLVNDYNKNYADVQPTAEVKSALVETIKQDIQSILDSESFVMEKPFASQIDSPTDIQYLEFFKNNFEEIANSDTRYSEFARAILDNTNALSDLLSNNPQKAIADDNSLLDISRLQFEKYLIDAVDQPDVTFNEWFKAFIDSITQLVTKTKDFEKNISEQVLTLEVLANSSERNIEDSLNGFLELVSVARVKLFYEFLDILEEYLGTSPEKYINETITIERTRVKSTEKSYVETLDAIESYTSTREKFVTELIESINDICSNELHRYFTETLSVTEDHVKEKTKAKTETINISIKGRIRLAPYDIENYFSVYDDYQPATTLS